MMNFSAVISVIETVPAVKKAVLFGSRAMGTHSRYSDIDIALFGEFDFLEVERIKSELEELPVIQKFDVVAYNEIKNSALREHIDRVGQVIFQRQESVT